MGMTNLEKLIKNKMIQDVNYTMYVDHAEMDLKIILTGEYYNSFNKVGDFSWLLEEYVKPPIELKKIEYELIKFWKDNGFDKLTKRSSDGRMYIYNSKTKNFYELKQRIFDGLFEFSDDFEFDEVLNNYEIIDE